VRALSRLMSDAHYRAKLHEAARQHGPDRLLALWEDILTETAGPGLAQGAETVAAGLLRKGVKATL
jgi:hypothetical protein